MKIYRIGMYSNPTADSIGKTTSITFAHFSVVGTWVYEREPCTVCDWHWQTIAPPLRVQWERSTKVIGDFSWDGPFGYAFTVKDSVAEALYNMNFIALCISRYGNSKGRIRRLSELRRYRGMGLYLCVFDEDNELDGVEVGSYSDFNFFRARVAELSETRVPRSGFPVLLDHSDSDGEWAASDCETLKAELTAIAKEFQQLPGIEFQAEWQQQVGHLLGLRPANLFESFIDVDGEFLLDRLIRLCDVAIEHGSPILFQ